MRGVLMRATIGDITGGHGTRSIGSIGERGEGCEAVGGSSDMNEPWLGGSSFGREVIWTVDGRMGEINPHSDMTIQSYQEIVTNMGIEQCFQIHQPVFMEYHKRRVFCH